MELVMVGLGSLHLDTRKNNREMGDTSPIAHIKPMTSLYPLQQNIETPSFHLIYSILNVVCESHGSPGLQSSPREPNYARRGLVFGARFRGLGVELGSGVRYYYRHVRDDL